MRAFAFLTVAALVSACGNAPTSGSRGQEETAEERVRRKQAEFEASPNMPVPELRERLLALGVADEAIATMRDDYGEEVLSLRTRQADFARLDKAKLAKLLLDSRYRFDFADEEQRTDFAAYAAAESHARDRAKALRELTERGEIDRFPRFRDGMPMTDYAPRLETYCGYAAGEALGVVDGRWLEYRSRMVDDGVVALSQGRSIAPFDCVKRIVDATDLRRQFIGNRGREGEIDY